jgi:hypothetical protein
MKEILTPNKKEATKVTLKGNIIAKLPMKIILVKADIKIIDEYSARKNKAKPIAEYSTL